jgi:hypothetical protein
MRRVRHALITITKLKGEGEREMKIATSINDNLTLAHNWKAKRGSVSIKVSLVFTALLVLGLALYSSFGRLAPTAQASAAGKMAAAANKTCDGGTLKGDYGFSFSGTITGLGSIYAIGAETCDGNGGCAGTATLSINGTTYTDTFTSVETISPNCTGVATVTYASGVVAHSATVLVSNGDEVHFMSTDPGAMANGVSKRR